RSIQANGKPVQFVSQPYESDIDHTGELSEAIVTFPQEIPPKSQIELDVRYEGVITLDTTRLTRIGTPKEVAAHTDWDQITPSFTAVRGVGYVTWYPVAMEAASLSEKDNLFAQLAQWKRKESDAVLTLQTCNVLGQAKLIWPQLNERRGATVPGASAGGNPQ